MANAALRSGDTRLPEIDPTLVARTLAELGGSAHIVTLFQKLQPKLNPLLDTPEPCLADLLQTLRTYQSHSCEPSSATAIFYQPFGENSYRWRLCEGVALDR